MPIASTEKRCNAPPERKPRKFKNCPWLRMPCHLAMSTHGIWTCTMITKMANAPNTNRIRLRISGTTSAFARLRQIVIDGQSFLKGRAGGLELRSSRRGESDIAELQALRRVAGRKDLHAVFALGDKAGSGQRFRADGFLLIPIFEINQI